MENPRKYGKPPYTVALLHGGPGASGEMASLARQLQDDYGVVEPLQTALSVQGQVEELEKQITGFAAGPVTIVGYSWGAWLGIMLSAKRPELVEKLILIGSGAFEDGFVQEMNDTRMCRLTAEEKEELEKLIKKLSDPPSTDGDAAFRRFGELFHKTDSFDPDDICQPDDAIHVSNDIYKAVWPEAAAMRSSGELLRIVRQVRCPVVAIHGDYDPTPAAGVEKPLAANLEQFSFVLVPKCGHTPWLERQAHTAFLQVLTDELKQHISGVSPPSLPPRDAEPL